jgi:acyl carrier protein
MDRETIFSTLKSNMQEIIEGARGRSIEETHSLVSDFHADSLEVVEVVSRTMKQLRIRVPRTQLSEPKNIGQLVDLFCRAADAAPRS